MLVPTAADSPRPIQVHTYPPHDAKPCLPTTLLEMFLRELSEEPHHNDFFCDSCGRPYTIAAQEGRSCTRQPEGGVICYGKVTRRWTKEKARVELRRLMKQGGVAIAWELGEPSVPVGLAVCEALRSATVIAAVDFPMSVLSKIYGKFGREEPFLVFSHLSLEGVVDTQRSAVVEKLIKDVVESMMGILGLSQAVILVPVSTRKSIRVRFALATMLEDKKELLLAHDQRPDRHRELWGFKLRAR